MSQIQNDFTGLVQHREMKDHFYAWIESFKFFKLRREKLLSLLNRKHYYDNLEAFGIWKKDTFFKTVVNLLDEFIKQPNEVELVTNVFYAWRRTAQFETVRKDCELVADQNSQHLVTKKAFKVWKGLTEPHMKTYLKIKKGINIITNTMLSKPYFELISISEKEKVKEKRAFFIYKRKKQEFMKKIIQSWRFTIEELKFENQKIKHISHHFKNKTESSQFSRYDLDSSESSEIISKDHSKPVFKVPTKILIQTTIIRSFQKYTPPTPISILQKYFNSLKYNLTVQRNRRLMLTYSSSYYKTSLLHKHFTLLTSTFYELREEHINMDTASSHFYYRSLQSAWTALKEAVKQNKLEKVCDLVWQAKLKRKWIQGFIENIEVNKNKNRLNWVMASFVKRGRDQVLKYSYRTWRHHFELERYYAKAVQEFREYRQRKLMKNVINFMAFQMKKQKKLGELEVRAKAYFSKKIELRLMQQAFEGLKKNHRREQFAKSGKAEMIAYYFYFNKVARGCFREWKKQANERKKKEQQSLKLTVFSAWKFHAKQS